MFIVKVRGRYHYRLHPERVQQCLYTGQDMIDMRDLVVQDVYNGSPLAFKRSGKFLEQIQYKRTHCKDIYLQ